MIRFCDGVGRYRPLVLAGIRAAWPNSENKGVEPIFLIDLMDVREKTKEKSVRPLFAAACLACLWLFTAGLAPPLLAGPVWDGDLVLFQQREVAAIGTVAELGATPVRLLNKARDGRQVVVAEVAAGWTHSLPVQRQHTIELLVLAGELSWDSRALAMHDFSLLPAAAPAPAWAAGPEGVSLLLFLDLPQATDPAVARVLDSASIAWRPGIVAQQDTGQALKLEVKDLLWVESTGQRTWLLRAGADLQVPWEVHDGVEEGYLLEGDYRIGECLPGEATPTTGDYLPGGYFYRPGGVVHSGPESGSQGGALWLLRTPTRLTVDFVDGCSQRD